MRIINAKIYTMEGPVIDPGFLEFSQGKITAVGSMEDMTRDETEPLDAKGKILLPGFLDAHTHLGMWEDSLGFEGDDGNEDTDPCTPHLRAIDAVNPTDRCFKEALAYGITTVVTGPGSADPVAGQMIAMKTKGVNIDKMVIRSPLAIKFALGENPKTVYHGKNQTPVTRMATAAIIREELFKAKKYKEAIQKAAEDEDTEEPEFDMKCEALLPLLRGEISAHFHAHRMDDIFTAIRIAKEFHLKYAIVHGTEGHLYPRALAEENARVLAGPMICDRPKPEMSAMSPSAPGILSKAGILTAIVTDHSVVPIQYLTLCAALAVSEGMEYDEALKAITINPAMICGIEDRVGSFKPGKDADFVLFDRDPLSLNAKPCAVYINGERVTFEGENG
ncbi:MAG: amidohydrolase [Clostridiales bacterium 43-6]|nr:MAG: amidohydrolase [Clostridiales bacterium 43-6]